MNQTFRTVESALAFFDQLYADTERKMWSRVFEHEAAGGEVDVDELADIFADCRGKSAVARARVARLVRRALNDGQR
jgi:hypothetical protein